MQLTPPRCGCAYNNQVHRLQRLYLYAASLASVALLVAILDRLNAVLNQASISLILVLLVVTIGYLFGRGPALLTAILAGLSFNYFFLAPRHTWRITRPEDAIAFAVLIVTAVIVGRLSSHAEKKTIQAEASRKSEQLKTALLDAVTHDLRTPLTSIKAAASTIRAGQVSKEDRDDLLQVIEEETDRLSGFIQSMVDLARVEAGSFPFAVSDVSAGEIIEDALTRAESLLSGHEVVVQAPDSLPPLRANPRLLSQVVFTLLENAAKYAPAGTRVEVSAAPNGAGIRFAVTDQGPGIPPDLQRQVFEKFVRGEGPHAGLGLGLTIARGIVEAHGGRIWIDSGFNGSGASIQFDIPTAPSRL